MFGTQTDDSMTTTSPFKPDLVVTAGTKIHGLQIGAIWLLVDSKLTVVMLVVARDNQKSTYFNPEAISPLSGIHGFEPQ